MATLPNQLVLYFVINIWEAVFSCETETFYGKDDIEKGHNLLLLDSLEIILPSLKKPGRCNGKRVLVRDPPQII
jgi:hypothetical protein